MKSVPCAPHRPSEQWMAFFVACEVLRFGCVIPTKRVKIVAGSHAGAALNRASPGKAATA